MAQNTRNKQKHWWSAFTLTEVIITLGLFSFIMASFSAIVSTVVQNAYVNDARTSLRQNLDFSSDVISRFLQNAQPESVLLFHGISNPNLKYCDVANDELCFADRSLTSSGEPQYYKIKFVKETVHNNAQNIDTDLGRLYLYQYQNAEDLSLTPSQAQSQGKILDSRVLTYRDTNLDVATNDGDTSKSNITINVPTASTGLTQPVLLITVYIEANSTYFVRHNTPAASNMQKLVSVQVQ